MSLSIFPHFFYQTSKITSYMIHQFSRCSGKIFCPFNGLINIWKIDLPEMKSTLPVMSFVRNLSADKCMFCRHFGILNDAIYSISILVLHIAQMKQQPKFKTWIGEIKIKIPFFTCF